MDGFTEGRATNNILNFSSFGQEENAFSIYIFKTFAEHRDQVKQTLSVCTIVTNYFFLL